MTTGRTREGYEDVKGVKSCRFAVSSFVHLAFLGCWTPILKMATGTIQKLKIGEEPGSLVKYCQRIAIRPLFRTMQATPALSN